MKKKSSLLKHLNELTREELIEEIEKVASRFDIVRQYFEIDLSGDTAPYVAKAKKNIYGVFYTTTTTLKRNPKASKLNKIIKDFEVLSIYKEDIIDLLCYRVATTVDYVYNGGNYSDQFEQSAIRAFERACKMIAEHDLRDKYREPCFVIVKRAIGLQMGETFTGIFEQYLF